MCRISSKSVNNCFCYRAPKFRDRQTDGQTDRQTEKIKVVQNSILSIYIYSKFISTTPISDFRKCLSECMIPFGYIYEGYNNVLRHCADNLAHVLAFLINLSFQEGVFPTILKQSVAIPVHKSGPEEDVNNYR